jgi:peroxiredoxin
VKKIWIYILLFTFISCTEKKKPLGEIKPQINFYAYNFKAIDTVGKSHSLYTELGQATILDFWASWCRPCRESANPHYLKLYKKYHERGLNIIGVSTDKHMYFWKKALRQDSLPWINLIDSTHQIIPRFEVTKIPKMFVLDKNGKIIAINIWGNKLEKTIDSLL